MKVVCLLSGGLDSCVAAAMVKSNGCVLETALSVAYGQRHADAELRAARSVAQALGFKRHEVVRLPTLASPVLTGDGPLPTEAQAGIAPTFVPSRNAIMLTLAANVAVRDGAEAIVTGVNAVDYSGYPDCRPEFVRAMERALTLGLDRHIRILAPLVEMSKSDIVREGSYLGAPLEFTWSCYAGGDRPCGVCDSCRIRSDGFKVAGLIDPALEGDV
jgi:7-cyano-7-deazaguanine synthase